ncbi:SusD/RagB family nutrient-binding outer membrane lipoprotein [Spirosoma sp. KUDC1026]|uniref:SusD/RagB family nutrient-binding outer membrane lipoprotein n=1 Tax=Spirosoma sp. KUDC1026 TaxID=2745947 RepID=UPI00159B9B28|nr:SusD/RagB family nutrient-binding outer membrane lipoprotein [Spirosoma sp. KUDC1026]QKZ11136.1 SusD/RagB family nutrient-binding outer membrane lipoprotein [Spirosoma sp. KUDC1026]
MRKYISSLVLAACMLAVSACKLDLLDNPNAVTTNNTDINYLLNSIELSYRNHFNQVSDPGMRLTRMINQGSAIYDNAVSPGNYDGLWSTAYAGLLTDVKTLIPLAESSQRFVHAGIARTLRASALLNLVDLFGDVPYTQAIDPTNFNPNTDTGATIYTTALADLDKAIENFGATSSSGAANDLIYGGTTDSWIRLANTLKLKALLNRRLVDKAGSTTAINALITANRLISTNAQNFTFKFGTNLTNPDTRHPRYAGQYSPTGGGDYQSNSYMGTLYTSKGFVDPRMRFYFYRQTVRNPTDVNVLRCVTIAKPTHYSDADVFCLPTTVGYWGRDHLSNEGIPPDGLLRTAWGVYPAGGLFDNNAGVPVSLGAGAGGSGIHPMMMRSFVDFMLAESALTLGTSGSARDLLKSAVEKSMADVRTLALGTTESGKITAYETDNRIVWADEVTKYVNKVLANYDAATTDDQRLNVIGTEYWLALFGNGIESYNLYRRTGKPANQQPALDPNPGAFARSLYYPSSYITRNANARQKANVTTPVFWDNNPANLLR